LTATSWSARKLTGVAVAVVADLVRGDVVGELLPELRPDAAVLRLAAAHELLALDLQEAVAVVLGGHYRVVVISH
jgi:hypothetical protein